MGLSQERRPWKESNATCARPICEALPSCRGLRARHAQKERIGSWEVPRLTSGNVTPWPASGRRGAEADDARTWEVGLCRTSCEAGEQGGAIRCGVGGAKGRDQGECGSAKHAPGSGTGKCVTGVTDPCPVPFSLTVTTPSSRMPALSHFWIKWRMRGSAIRCSKPKLPPVQSANH